MTKKSRKNNYDEPKYKQLSPKTKGQNDYIRAISESEITFCTGPAGTGKTHIAVGLACEYFMTGKVKNIIITRPLVETGGDRLGVLPGSVCERMHPYLYPLLTEIQQFLGKYNTQNYVHNESIHIVPLQVMRGYNFHNSFIILDESQNATLPEIKMCLTRLGRNSKMIVAGDIEQSDLYKDNIGLTTCMDKLSDLKDISLVKLTNQDIVRNSIIGKILERLK